MNDLCVVFDIDDTLYLERDYVVSGFTAVGAWADAWLGLRNFAGRCIEAHERGYRGQMFNLALAQSGRQASPELIAAMVSIYRTHVPAIRLFDDALRTLEGVRGKCPAGVISDGPAVSQSRKAEALGLARFTAPIYLTELFGKECAKPSPVVFRHMENTVGARRYVYVADNPAKDFQAPAMLGWHTVRIRRAGGLHCSLDNTVITPDYELADCSDLPSLLRSLPGKTGAVA